MAQASTAGRVSRRRRSGGEGRAAAAGRLRVRIADHELRTLEAFAIVDFGADQILKLIGSMTKVTP